MIIYMLFNEITEKAYIGKTTHTLDERWEGHVYAASTTSTSPMSRAIRKWGTDVWIRVVLQSCMSEEEMDVAEGNWIQRCETYDPAIGYNVVRVPSGEEKALLWYAKQVAKQRVRTYDTPLPRRREDMSEEELQRYRDWGKLGAQVSCQRKNMSEEERKEQEKERQTQRKLRNKKRRNKSGFNDLSPKEKHQKFVEWGKKGLERSRQLLDQ